MAVILYIFLIFLGFTSHTTTTTKANPIDTIDVNIKGQGLVRGNYDTTPWTDQTFMQFRGIPYAESPSGPLRYKAPIPRQPWTNYIDATNWGRRCPVYTTIVSLNETELQEDLEDCLNLCVYTKNLTGKSQVMFYIHGGGFYNGTSLDHPGKYLMEKDIVLVVPQYRIGAFGFISTGTDEIPGNAAIADMLFALQWVQEYIGTFGGDPERVTIFGQSAGAAIAGILLLSPKTPENFFQRVIMQSGSIMADWAKIPEPRIQSKRICNALGCSDCETNVQMNACLMKASVTSIISVTRNEWISPVLDDKLGILPQHPKELFKQLNRPVSVMTGFTKHDGSYVLGVYYDEALKLYGKQAFTVRQFISKALDGVNDYSGSLNNLQTRLFFDRDILDSTNQAKALPSYFDLFSFQSFKSPTVTLTSQLIKKNLGKTYLYSFDYEGEHTRFGYEMGNEHYPFNGGIHHSNDNIYLFSTHPLNERDTRMSMKMVDYWTSFAITGTPYSSVDDNITLPHMETESGPYFHINEKTTIGYDVYDEFTATMDDPENYKLLRSKVSFL